MILMRGIDITWAIGRVGLKVKPVLGHKTSENHNDQGPYKKTQILWYFYANENR